VPGIVGLITKRHRGEAEAQLKTMLKSIHHEDFYTYGTSVDEPMGVYAGWSAMRGSFSDDMPLASENGKITLVFSGEEYPDPAIVQGVRNRGHQIGPAQSAYLVHLYEENLDFLQNLNGMFHGLIVDRERGLVQLFNDRFGMHRLYYHQSGDTFYFATEAKAILAVRPELRAADPRSLGEFVACSCVLENRTIFKDIHVLPAASSWIFRNGRLESKNTYFTPQQWEAQSPASPEAYFEELRSVLLKTLPHYFSGDQQLGIAMTGGLDTRVILSCHPPQPGSLHSYTFGSKYRDTYDVRIGRSVAKLCRQPHQVIEVGEEFLTKFPDYAERSILMTEGTVDLYRASDLYLSEKVRQIAPAKIVGTYGSEIVRRAVMFRPVEPPAGLLSPDFLSQVHTAANTYATLRDEHPVTFAAFRQSPWYHHGILALEQSQLTVRSPFMDNEFVRAAYRAPIGRPAEDDVRVRLIKDANPALGRIRSDRGVGGNGSRLGSLLTHLYREFTFKAEYAYDYGMPQSAARVDHAFSGLHLERLFFGRHKALHFRVWYRDELADYVRQILLDPRTLSRPYLQRKTVEGMVKSHLDGTRNHTEAIHKLLTLELVQRLLFEA
jgi:asparagine synthase (glutamine-hydrolysing)